MASQPARRSHRITDFLDGIIRRIFSLVISAAGMLLLFPMYLAIVMLIKRDSPGPVIHKEARVGKRGRLFMIRKFRTTLSHEPSSESPAGMSRTERRATAFGAFLRESKLDELPQLWNVFRGDMNLVGPRAEDPKTVAEWPEEICREILSVRPGLTGPASVLYTYFDNLLQTQNVMERSLFDVLPTRLRLDQIYVRRRNLLTDLDVLGWTALALLPRLRRIPFPENLHPPGVLRALFSPDVFGFLTDLLAAFLAAAAAGSLFPSGFFLLGGMESSVGFYIVIALIYSLVNLVNGSHRVDWKEASAGDSLDLAISTGLVTLVIVILNLMVPGEPLTPPPFLALTGVLAFAGFVLLRYRERLITALAAGWTRLRGYSLDRFGEPVLIVGGGDTGRFTLSLLHDGPLARAFRVAGIVDDDPAKAGASIDGVEVIGTTGDIPALSKALDVGLVFFAINEIDPGESRRIARLCRGCGVRMIRVPDMMSLLPIDFPKDEDGQVALIGAVLQDSTHDHLTGVYHRQSFLRHLERELSRSEERGMPCSLLAFEVGYQWPDAVSRSRALSDQALQVVAERTQKVVRKVDIFGRIGENDFALILPGADARNAARMAARLKRAVESVPVWTDRGPLNITVTTALLSHTAGGRSAGELLEEALRRIKAEKPVGVAAGELSTIPAGRYRQEGRRM